MAKRVLLCLAMTVALSALGCGQKGGRLTTSSKEALAEYELGITAADKLYFEEAAGHFGKAVELDSGFAMAYSRLSRALQNLGDEAQAREYQAQALTLMTDPSGKDRVTEKEGLFIVFQNASLHDNFDLVQETIERWVERFPEDYEAHAFLGMEHQRSENHDQALAAYQRAAELNPNYAQAYNALGYLYLAKGDFDQALENLKRYRDMVPDQANPYDSIGELEQARGNYQEAIKHYQKALEINPDLRFVLHHLGEIFRIQGQYARAIGYFLEAAEKAQGAEAESISRQYLAYCYLRRGNLKQALTEALRAVELYPKDPIAHYNLGLVHVAMGDLSAALADAERTDLWLTKRDLKRYGSDRALFHLMGEIYLATKEYDLAIDSHWEALQKSPNPLYNLFYVHALGYAYYQAGRLDQAVATLEKAIGQNPNHADCLYTMALIYKDKGEKKLAREWLDRFKEVFKDADEEVEWVEKAIRMKV
jgi:tetratricopeptide (TPR) repeat protein